MFVTVRRASSNLRLPFIIFSRRVILNKSINHLLFTTIVLSFSLGAVLISECVTMSSILTEVGPFFKVKEERKPHVHLPATDGKSTAVRIRAPTMLSAS